MSPASEVFVKRLVALTSLVVLGSAIAFLLVACAQGGSASSAQPPAVRVAGWHSLPAAPIEINGGLTSVWTGSALIVSGVRAGPDGTFVASTDVAAAYDPAAHSWRRLPRPPKTPSFCGRNAVWSGAEMLVWGCESVAYEPATNHWRRLPQAPGGAAGIVVWTGHEMIGWGGGCCGDSRSDGAAYDPSADSWRKLAESPLAPEQGAIGAWTGRELLLFVSGIDPASGKPWPARLARAAAYDPATDTWRRIAPLPERGLRFGGTAVWNGHELLVIGAGPLAQGALAYDPGANRWRRLAPLPSGRVDPAAVWTGKRLLVWGLSPDPTAAHPGGFAYDPTTDRWSSLPPAPVRGSGQTVDWTGRQLILWGGVIGTPLGTSTPPRYLTSGAAFTPAPERSAR
jgi:hypothetical protein